MGYTEQELFDLIWFDKPINWNEYYKTCDPLFYVLAFDISQRLGHPKAFAILRSLGFNWGLKVPV